MSQVEYLFYPLVGGFRGGPVGLDFVCLFEPAERYTPDLYPRNWVCGADSRDLLSRRDRAALQPLDFLPERLPLLPLGLGEVGRRRVAHAGSAGKDAEIAEVMGLTSRAVKSLLSRARENLRAALSGYVSLDGEPLPEAPGVGLQGRRQGRDGRAPRRQADPDRPWSAGNC